MTNAVIFISVFFIANFVLFNFNLSLLNPGFNVIDINKSNKNLFTEKNNREIDVGEEIVYVVKYLFIPIGEIKLKITAFNQSDSIYSAIAYIDSYSGLPFVDLHQIYETRFNRKQIPIYFKGTILGKDTTFTTYNFDYQKRKIHIIKGSITKNEIWTDSTASLNNEYLDGLALFILQE